MKKTIIILIIVAAMAAIARAGDPNTMPRPTAQDPITINFEPEDNRVTFMCYIPDDNRWAALTTAKYLSPIKNILLRMITKNLNRWARDIVAESNSDLVDVAAARAARDQRDGQ